MATIRGRKYPRLVRDVSRHGTVRWYVRAPGKRKVRITEEPGTPAFDVRYFAIMAGKQVESAPDTAGSLGWLWRQYKASEDFKALDPSTQRWRTRGIEKIRPDRLGLPFRLMDAQAVRDLRDELRPKNAMANERLKALQALFRWAINAGRASSNPTAGVDLIKYAAKGHHSWTIEEVAAYEKRWPVGTKQRLALAILLYTACRREDVIALGPRHMSEGRLRYRQAKNQDRSPVDMDIPVHADLAAVIAATPTGLKSFLVSAWGRPYSVWGFGVRFREWCDRAGLPHCSAHGLRKACATRLAERGVSAHGIMSITGHKTLEEVEVYTRAARRKILADEAMSKL